MSGQESERKRRANHEKGIQGNGGSAATAGMKVCEQSGSKESLECRAQQLKPHHGGGRREAT